MIITLYLLAAIAFIKGPSLTQHVQIYSEVTFHNNRDLITLTYFNIVFMCDLDI